MPKLVLSLFLLGAAIPAWCQPRGGFGRGGMMRSPAFQALDTNKDGVISPPELANAAELLKSLDKNGDGKLTEDEVRPQFGGRGERGGRGGDAAENSGPTADELVKTLMAFDKNSDGRLTHEEVPERMQGLFERADADKDGFLTADEIRKSAQATAATRGFGRSEGRGERFSFMRIDPILAALDADSNGEISAAELKAAPTALKKLDKDGNGQLSQDEVRPNIGQRPGRGRA